MSSFQNIWNTNDLDWGSLGAFTWFALMSFVFFMYLLMVWRLRAPVTLLVMMTTLLFSMWIKSAITSDLMFFNALLMLVTCTLESFMNLLALSKFIGTITCFLDGLLVVIFNFSLGLLLLLMIFWIFWIFLFWRLGNTSLILRVSLAVLVLVDDTWVYNFFSLLSKVFLKYFKISTTFLGNFARIREGRTETYASLLVSLPFLGVISLFICGLN